MFNIAQCLQANESSIDSSASAKAKRRFKLPEHWRPSVQACFDAATEEEQRRMLTPEIRDFLVRDGGGHCWPVQFSRHVHHITACLPVSIGRARCVLVKRTLRPLLE